MIGRLLGVRRGRRRRRRVTPPATLLRRAGVPWRVATTFGCRVRRSPQKRRHRRAEGLAAGLLVVAAWAWFARRHLGRVLAASHRYVRRPSPAERPVLIVNRWSGDGKAERLGLADEARSRGVETVLLERGDDLRQLAEDAVARGADALGMAGGDGSLGLVAAVAAEHDLPFFCVPVGTRNHFALDLGLDRDDPLAALDALDGGDELRIDHGLVGDRLFLNNASFGVYGEVVHRPEYRGAKASTVASAAVATFESEDERPDVRFTTPDGRDHTTAAVLLVSNNPYVLSGPPDFGRRSRLDEGVLGIRAVGEPSADDGTTPSPGPAIHRWSATSYRVEAAKGTLAVGVDGEAVTLDSPVDLSIRPRKLRVLVPAGTRPGYLTPPDQVAVRLLDLIGLAGEPEPSAGGRSGEDDS